MLGALGALRKWAAQGASRRASPFGLAPSGVAHPWGAIGAVGSVLDPLRGARYAPSGLEAGSTRRRFAAQQPAAAHVNALMQAAGSTVNARARYLVRNNGYAKAALSSWTTASVGAGIKPSSLVEDQMTREAIHKAWFDWTDEADAEEVADFYGITERVSREAYLGGECFVRLRPRFPQDGLSVPLQLQLLPSEQLPLWKQEVVPPGQFNAGGAIRLGIEFDRNLRNKRVAYWFYRANPIDQTITFADAVQQEKLVRVPAEEVIHVFDPVEVGQVRGLSRYHAAMFKLFQLDLYDDAELERQNQQAKYAAFVELPIDFLPTDDTGNPIVPKESDPMSAYEAGAFVTLKPGEKVNFAQPGGVASSYELFQYRTICQICAALGVPYGEISWDLTKATYASSRAGLLAFRQQVEAFQHAVLVFQFLRRVWARWMDAAVLAGAIPISAQAYNARPAFWRAMKAITPRAPWVDPVKDIQAEIMAVGAGFKSRSDVIEAIGYDPEETDRRIAEDRKREAELFGPGFSFATSVGARGGAVAPAEPAPTASEAA